MRKSEKITKGNRRRKRARRSRADRKKKVRNTWTGRHGCVR